MDMGAELRKLGESGAKGKLGKDHAVCPGSIIDSPVVRFDPE